MVDQNGRKFEYFMPFKNFFHRSLLGHVFNQINKKLMLWALLSPSPLEISYFPSNFNFQEPTPRQNFNNLP